MTGIVLDMYWPEKLVCCIVLLLYCYNFNYWLLYWNCICLQKPILVNPVEYKDIIKRTTNVNHETFNSLQQQKIPAVNSLILILIYLKGNKEFAENSFFAVSIFIYSFYIILSVILIECQIVLFWFLPQNSFNISSNLSFCLLSWLSGYSNQFKYSEWRIIFISMLWMPWIT